MSFRNFFLIIAASLFVCLDVFAQKTDSIAPLADTVKKVSPLPATENNAPFKDAARLELEKRTRRAAIHSAIIPGWGQINNRRWWKVPLVYGGFVGIGLVFEFNNRYYHTFLKEAQFRAAHPGQKQNPLYINASDQGIIFYKDAYRRNRDLSVLAGLAFYGINIIDAYIDAKFFRFDISNDLSLQVKPSLMQQPQPFSHASTASPAVKLSLSL